MARELPRIERRNFIQLPGKVSPVGRAVAPVPEIGDPGAVGRAISQLGKTAGQLLRNFADEFQRTATIKEYNAANRSLLDANFQAKQAAAEADNDPEIYRRFMNNWHGANSDKFSNEVWGKIDRVHADLSFQGVSKFARISKAKDDAFNLSSYESSVADLESQLVDAIGNGEGEVANDLRDHIQDYHLIAAENGMIDVAVAQDSMRLLDDKLNIAVGQTQVSRLFDSSGYDEAQKMINSRDGVFIDPDVRVESQSVIDTMRTIQKRQQADIQHELALKQGKATDLVARNIRIEDVTENQLFELFGKTDENGDPIISVKSQTRLLDTQRAEVRRRKVIVNDFKREQDTIDKKLDKEIKEENKLIANNVLIEYSKQVADTNTPYPTYETLSLFRDIVPANKFISMQNAWFKNHDIGSKRQLEVESYDSAYLNRVWTPSADAERTRKNEETINDPSKTDQQKLLELIDDSEVLGVVSNELGKFSKGLIAKGSNAANVRDSETASQIRDEAVGGFVSLRSMQQKSPLVYLQLPEDVRREVDYFSSQTQGSRLDASEAIESRVEFLKRPVAVQRQLEKVAFDVRLNEDYVITNFSDAFVQGIPGPAISNLMADFNTDYKRRILNGESVDDSRASSLEFVKSQWKEGLEGGRFMKFSPKAFQEKYLPGSPSNFPNSQFDREYLDLRQQSIINRFPIPLRSNVRIEATNNTRGQFSNGVSPEYAVVLKEEWEGHQAGERVIGPDGQIMTWKMEYQGSVEQREKQYADSKLAEESKEKFEELQRRKKIAPFVGGFSPGLQPPGGEI